MNALSPLTPYHVSDALKQSGNKTLQQGHNIERYVSDNIQHVRETSRESGGTVLQKGAKFTDFPIRVPNNLPLFSLSSSP